MKNKQTSNILLFAHPGHELRIYHWMEMNKPLVFLLTDGSGSKEKSRTHYSYDVIEKTGSAAGSVFGNIADYRWYEALKSQDHDFFASIFSSVLNDIADHESFRIIADARDEYNPIHDLASAMGVLLQKCLIKRGARTELCYSAATMGGKGDVVYEAVLDQKAHARKLAAITSYLPLADEARLALEQDPSALDKETLISQNIDWYEPNKPQWEEIGRQRVLAGVYDSCLTYEDHFLPVISEMFRKLVR